MRKRKYTPAKAEANKRYDKKTYTVLKLYLRSNDDADIIESIKNAKDNGIAYRDWLRDLFDHQG